MAANTTTKTSYGLLVTGGTTATDVVVSGAKVFVKRFVYIPATDADTVVVKDTVTGASIFKTKGTTAGTAYLYDVGGEVGAPYLGLNVTLSGASDELHIYLA